MRLSEVLLINNSLANQLSKIDTEITTKFAELQTAIDDLTSQLADVTLTPEQQASVDAVVASVQTLDDLVPDAEPVEPVEEPAA